MVLVSPNERVLASFVDYLKVEKGLAPLTVAAYTRDVMQFADSLQKLKPARSLLRARREEVRAFLDQLFSNQVDGRSVARKLSSLRHFYKYLLLDRMVERDPTLNIDMPRQWKVLPKALSRQEAVTLMGSATPKSNRREAAAIAARDRALLEMLYAGGDATAGAPPARLGAQQTRGAASAAGLAQGQGMGKEVRVPGVWSAALRGRCVLGPHARTPAAWGGA